MPSPTEDVQLPPTRPEWLAKVRLWRLFAPGTEGSQTLKEHFTENEGELTERSEERVKEQARRILYCANCEDQLLKDKFTPGINNERLFAKLLDKGHRDKATKEITPFETMLGIGNNFEQCEKAKAVMQEAKGSTEQVNPLNQSKTEQVNPLNQRKTRVKVILIKANKRKNGNKVHHQGKFVSIVQGHHTLALYAQLQTSDALEKAVGESNILLGRVEWEYPL